jgi:hypothetical protein
MCKGKDPGLKPGLFLSLFRVLKAPAPSGFELRSKDRKAALMGGFSVW